MNELQKTKMANVRGLLDSMKPQLSLAVPKHMTGERMARIAATECLHTPKLLDCTPESLAGAVLQAASLGLEIGAGLGRVYLVPYGNKVTLIVGYRGLMDLVRRSGEISTIDAKCVYEKDGLDFSYGTEQRLEHRPHKGSDAGELKAVYAVALLKDGGKQFEVMWKSQVDEIRNRSKASGAGPWKTDYNEMARKTVMRKLCKYLPMSIEMATAVALDGQAEMGIPQNLQVNVGEPAIVEQSGGGLEGVKARLLAESDATNQPVGAEPEEVAANA